MNSLLFVFFFVSGFCGLLYQIAWTRIAFAHFGVITPVLSVVVSVFMGGLALGTWFAGRLSSTSWLGRNPLRTYGIVELLIALTASTVPLLFRYGESILLPTGSIDSHSYLIWSGLILALVMLPPCIFMGMTYPTMMAYLKARYPERRTGFSFLYAANVFGALCGTFFTALVLIEVFGLNGSLNLAIVGNSLIGIGALFKSKGVVEPSLTQAAPLEIKSPASVSTRLCYWLLFTTGFSSMGMEVAWTRAFTPVLKTHIYSFAKLLAVYLFATWLGSIIYRKHILSQKTLPISILLPLTALFSFFPIVFNDPRFHSEEGLVLLSLIPLCSCLGYLTPMLIDQLSGGDPRLASRGYALNIVGSILGPLVTGYLLLPQFGVKLSLCLLCLPLVVFAWKTSKISVGDKIPPFWRRALLPTASLLLLGLTTLKTLSFEDASFHKGEVRRDYTATVISMGEGMEKRLLVNGIGITHLTTITKVMAHLPLFSLSHQPENSLVICFGMGTTFRSLLSWDIRATAVELVPSVRDAFGYYFEDAAKTLANPKGHIEVDDGRRFLRRTNETFDVVTIDPPPPVQAAGSSLLYSTEFYSLLKSRLRSGGILQQWYPDGKGLTLSAVARSLHDSFRHVVVLRSYEGWGYHFLASDQPIQLPTVDEALTRMPEMARRDLLEWLPSEDLNVLLGKILNQTLSVEELLVPDLSVKITDNYPFNEYYAYRRTLVNLKLREAY